MNAEGGLLYQIDLILNDPFRKREESVAVKVGLRTGASFVGDLRGVYHDGLSLTTADGMAFVAADAIASVVLLSAAALTRAESAEAAAARPGEGGRQRRAFHHILSRRDPTDSPPPVGAVTAARVKSR